MLKRVIGKKKMEKAKKRPNRIEKSAAQKKRFAENMAQLVTKTTVSELNHMKNIGVIGGDA